MQSFQQAVIGCLELCDDGEEAQQAVVGVELQGEDRRGGLVWHTQGSGKSFTMGFFVTKLRRDPRFSNPTVVMVTDRTDLDSQLAQLKRQARQAKKYKQLSAEIRRLEAASLYLAWASAARCTGY